MTLTQFVRTSASALGALVIASALPANAADLYHGGGSLKDVPVAVPAPLWTGFYAGLNAGATFTHRDIDGQNFTFPDNGSPNPPGDPIFHPGNLDTTNAFGGGQIGFNWQSPGCCIVYGVELDLGGVGGNNERTAFITDPNTGQSAAVRFRREGGFYGDITGRIGYAWNNTALLYAKGGFAWLNSNFKIHETAFDGVNSVTTFDGGRDHNDTLTGWTVGGGIEWMVGPSWSVKLEYLHFNFGHDDLDCCGDNFVDGVDGNHFRDRHDLEADTVKLGVNYFFHGAPEALPYK